MYDIIYCGGGDDGNRPGLDGGCDGGSGVTGNDVGYGVDRTVDCAAGELRTIWMVQTRLSIRRRVGSGNAQHGKE